MQSVYRRLHFIARAPVMRTRALEQPGIHKIAPQGGMIYGMARQPRIDLCLAIKLSRCKLLCQPRQHQRTRCGARWILTQAAVAYIARKEFGVAGILLCSQGFLPFGASGPRVMHAQWARLRHSGVSLACASWLIWAEPFRESAPYPGPRHRRGNECRCCQAQAAAQGCAHRTARQSGDRRPAPAPPAARACACP